MEEKYGLGVSGLLALFEGQCLFFEKSGCMYIRFNQKL